jgi:RNA polymerase sigma-70 factor (ECF subfamily)
MRSRSRPSKVIAFPAAARFAGMADEDLMARFAREGEDAAFEALAERYYAPALAVARARVCDDALAQDVVQEAFVRVIRERRRYDPRRSFAAWFYTVLRNVSTDAIRRRARHRDKMELFACGETVSPVGAGGFSDCGELLAALAAQDREVLICHYIHGMSLREVAEVLGIQEEAAKKRAQRALKKLKVAMSRNGDFERTVSKHGT